MPLKPMLNTFMNPFFISGYYPAEFQLRTMYGISDIFLLDTVQRNWLLLSIICCNRKTIQIYLIKGWQNQKILLVFQSVFSSLKSYKNNEILIKVMKAWEVLIFLYSHGFLLCVFYILFSFYTFLSYKNYIID